ncbi:MAG: hypothetical protein ABR593_10715 [Candidatus Limnocylindria bacterium]
MSAEHERLLGLVAPLRERGWVFLPTTLAAPTNRHVVDALFGLRTHHSLEDNIQLWEQWAIAARLRKTDQYDTQLWHRSGRIEVIVQELLTLPD